MRNPNTIFLGRSTVRLSSVLFMYVKEAGGGQDAWLSRTLKAWRRSSRGIFNQRTNTKISSSSSISDFFFFSNHVERERKMNQPFLTWRFYLFFFSPSYVISSFPSIATKITKLCCCPISFFFFLPPLVASYCRGSTRILSCVGWK